MPVLAPIQRFFQPGITIVREVPLIANRSAPTRAELAAGTIITKHVRGQEGFSLTSGQIDTPDMSSRFPSKIGGMLEVEDSSLRCYAARDGVDIRSVFERGDITNIVLQYGGDVATYPMDIFPVEVIGVPKESSMDEAFGVNVQFSIISEPAIDVPTPALT